MAHPPAAIVSRQSQGSARQDSSNSPSLPQLYATLVPVIILAAILTTAFLVLRRVLKRNYAPRTFIGSLRPQ